MKNENFGKYLSCGTQYLAITSRYIEHVFTCSIYLSASFGQIETLINQVQLLKSDFFHAISVNQWSGRLFKMQYLFRKFDVKKVFIVFSRSNMLKVFRF